jgi:hypothetical protein
MGEVDSNLVPDHPYSASVIDGQEVPHRSQPFSAEATPTLSQKAALLFIVLLTLGLWCAIWVAGCLLLSFLSQSTIG